MKAKELEKLFKDKLQKDGVNKEWLDSHFEVIGLDTESNQEEDKDNVVHDVEELDEPRE